MLIKSYYFSCFIELQPRLMEEKSYCHVAVETAELLPSQNLVGQILSSSSHREHLKKCIGIICESSEEKKFKIVIRVRLCCNHLMLKSFKA